MLVSVMVIVCRACDAGPRHGDCVSVDVMLVPVMVIVCRACDAGPRHGDCVSCM